MPRELQDQILAVVDTEAPPIDVVSLAHSLTERTNQTLLKARLGRSAESEAQNDGSKRALQNSEGE